MPEALSSAACVDVPLATTFLSLPFYLLVLLGSSVHVLVCTSSEASCYFCSLPWLLAFATIIFSSALFSSLVAVAARCPLKFDNKPLKVSETEEGGKAWGTFTFLGQTALDKQLFEICLGQTTVWQKQSACITWNSSAWCVCQIKHKMNSRSSQ